MTIEQWERFSRIFGRSASRSHEECQRCGGHAPIEADHNIGGQSGEVCENCQMWVCNHCIDWAFMREVYSILGEEIGMLCIECAKEAIQVSTMAYDNVDEHELRLWLERAEMIKTKKPSANKKIEFEL